jgi:hypothetical protein
VDVRIPDQSISDELERVAETKKLTRGPHEDLRTWCHRILTGGQASPAGAGRSDLRYIARQLHWLLTVEGLPAYYLALRDPHDLDDLIACLGEPKDRNGGASASAAPGDNTSGRHDPGEGESGGGTRSRTKTRTARRASGESVTDDAAKPAPNAYGHQERREGHDLCLFVGSSPLVPVETHPGIAVPTLAIDYLCSFDHDTLTSWVKTSAGAPPQLQPAKIRAFSSTGQQAPNDFFNRLVQSADNFGDTDEWRALNYLAVQYPRLYRCYADMLQDGYDIDSIRVVKSRLWGGRRIVDPVFAFRNESGHVERYFVRMDVSHLFPTIVNHLANYFER